MIRKITIFYLLIVFFIPEPDSLSKTDSDAQRIISELLISLKDHNFIKAAELFHYHNDFTHEEYLAEKQSVKEGLEKYQKIFGDFRIVRQKTSGKKDLIGVGISGGDFSDLSTLKNRIPAFLFEATFEKVGFGQILIWTGNINNEWEILFLQYGFPKTDRMKKIISDILKEHGKEAN